jgi:YbbR domain-containing protein
MDIAKINVSDTVTVDIYLPDGTLTDLKITAFTVDSKKYKSVAHAIRNKTFQRRSTANTSERSLDNAMEILVKTTKSWENMKENGIDIPCDDENVRRIYTKFPFITEQIDVAQGRRVDFLTIAPEN